MWPALAHNTEKMTRDEAIAEVLSPVGSGERCASQQLDMTGIGAHDRF
jgi:hypothetical protein